VVVAEMEKFGEKHFENISIFELQILRGMCDAIVEQYCINDWSYFHRHHYLAKQFWR
jgi:hypothetical protein